MTRHYAYCIKCFSEIGGDRFIVAVGNASCVLSKMSFRETKNNIYTPEMIATCIHCQRTVHKICVLYHESIWPEGFQCDGCLRQLRTLRRDNKYSAKRLPTTKLGDYLESRVNDFLQKSNCSAGEVIIRVVSSTSKLLDTGPGMMDRFPEFPAQFPYTAKVILVFEEMDGVEVCFFGMHVQEYGSDCPAPNARQAYISYLDSVNFFTPKEYRTPVYHEILLIYLEYIKLNGFQTAHIWACPPGDGDAYIFHCHPPEQKIPRPKRLVEWYRQMLERGKEQCIIYEFMDIFRNCTEEEIQSVTQIPYFEGDFWPNVIEETIRCDAVDSISNKGKRGANNRKRPKKILNAAEFDDNLFQKVHQSMAKYREVFIVVSLHPPSELPSLPPTTEPDTTITCSMIDDRDTFLSIAQEKHWEFSSLRRAKYSTMIITHELHNQISYSNHNNNNNTF